MSDRQCRKFESRARPEVEQYWLMYLLLRQDQLPISRGIKRDIKAEARPRRRLESAKSGSCARCRRLSPETTTCKAATNPDKSLINNNRLSPRFHSAQPISLSPTAFRLSGRSTVLPPQYLAG
jgi:hypothetical protein